MLNEWRLILDSSGSGTLNMAVDEVLLNSANSGTEPRATLRLYAWDRPTISIGYRQDPADFAQFNLPVVKRLTGGRAVLHDSELTYSITVPRKHPLYGGGITGAYAIISNCIVAALKEVGVYGADFVPPERAARGSEGRKRSDACFLSSSRYEVVVGGKKMVGSAQRRFSGAFLQHGSILAGVDSATLQAVFGPSLINKITWLGAHTSATVEELREALVKSVALEMGCTFAESSLTGAEKERLCRFLETGLDSSTPDTLCDTLSVPKKAIALEH